MNILLWVLQILLASYYAMGGFYQLNVKKLPGAWLKILPGPGWLALGGLQVLFAVGLVLPGAAGVLPILTPIAAACLAVQTVAVSAMTGVKYPGFLWTLVPALLALFVAYGRLALQPF